MSSREIADLTGKRHDNVRADIEKMGRDLSLSFQEKLEPSEGGRPAKVFHLAKRECTILVSGYDVTMRAKIVDRWLFLEEQAARPTLPDLSDPMVLTGLLLEHTAKRAEAEALVRELQPKADAHDRLTEAHGSVCRSTAAKNLGVPVQTLTRWMRSNGWTFRRPTDRDDLAYHAKIVAGLLEHKVTTGLRADGTEWVGTQVRVTAKGMLALAKAFPPAVAPAPSRRNFVAGIGALVLAATSALVPVTKAKAGLPAVIQRPAYGPTGAHRELLVRYAAFLINEHQAVLEELFPPYTDSAGETFNPRPMMWRPEGMEDLEAAIKARPPSSRALMVLSAGDPDLANTVAIHKRWRAGG